ncbi:MAG TPA: hypothetical protein VML01_09655 [Bryobacterales bacterium]|nr:hypothetical protein [Bryobacterales bacterium]
MKVRLQTAFLLITSIGCTVSSPPDQFTWQGRFVGGSAIDDCDDIAVDSNDFVYLACHGMSNDLPGIEVSSDAPDTGMNAYVLKLSPDLQHVSYAVILAGSAFDGAFAIAVDRRGHAFVTGFTGSKDFPVTANAIQGVYGGGEADVFIAELDPTGKPLHVSYVGGSDTDQAFALELGADGSVLVGGATWSADFPGLGRNQTAGEGGADAFVVRVSLGAEPSLQAMALGGQGYEKITGIASSRNGEVFISGLTESPDFPALNAMQSKLQGSRDGFVAKLSGSNLELLYATFFGGAGEDAVWGIDILDDGRPVFAGGTKSPDLPTTAGAIQSKSGGGGDAFVAVLSDDGSSVDYCTYFGGGGEDSAGFDGSTIKVDSTGQIWFVGLTDSTDLPTKAPLQSVFGGGDQDGFVAALHLTEGLRFATYIGGEGRDLAEGLALSPTGGVLVTGLTSSQRLPFSLTPPSRYAGGPFDNLLVRIQARRAGQ